MKRFYKNFIFLVLIVLLVACKTNSANSEVKADTTTDNSLKQEEQEEKNEKRKKEFEEIKLEEKKVPHQNIDKENLRLVAGTKEVSEILKKYGYENPVAVPESCQLDFPNAKVFGPEDDPDYDLLKTLKPTLYISDSGLTYKNGTPNDKLNCRVFYYPLTDARFKEYYSSSLIEISYLIYEKDKAEEVINKLNLKADK